MKLPRLALSFLFTLVSFLAICSLSYASISLIPSRNCDKTPLEAFEKIINVHNINLCRAKLGISRLRLPSNWSRLTKAQQVFVITDLERTARHLVPYVGLTYQLDGAAQQGANHNEDPVTTGEFISNWAGIGITKGQDGALASDYFWIYDDGYFKGGKQINVDCLHPEAPGCWGHTRTILVTKLPYDNSKQYVAGVGYHYEKGTGSYSLIVTPDIDQPLVFTWRGEVKYLSH
jgi:hypothetical protein